jgi:UTP--glucose-1-phosphate uridylyltransferase
MGAAISLFDGAVAVKVPRTRFFPVKSCSDLLVLRSDFFVYTKNDDLLINPLRKGLKNRDTINIKLDPKYYKKIDDLEERFCHGVPSLANCESLTIEGDVAFEKNVEIKGSVLVKNTKKFQMVIEEGALIDQDLVL